ncbi:PH domain-containing protein [Georgenia deserti]|uniref:PH domain-containing protein n=1 Tax=Georgenia deserti TaxID=2093781 RepID=A0ABW4L0B5_9MICO
MPPPQGHPRPLSQGQTPTPAAGPPPGPVPGPPPHGGHPGPPDAEHGPVWRSVHKITPILNAWQVIAAVIAVLVVQALQQASQIPQLWSLVQRYRVTAILIILGVVLLVALVAGIYSALAWRRMKFAVTSESVDLHSGILFRRQRHARLVRIQAVDVVQPLLGRLFGLAQVKVETAGGNESNVVIGYLKEPEAQAVRNEVMARAAGVAVPESGAAATGPAAAGAPSAGAPGTSPPVIAAAPERQLLRVPDGRLVASLVVSPSLIALLVALAGLVVAAYLADNPGPIFAGGPGFIGWIIYLWGRFAGEFHFRVATSPDGIRLRHGLLETRSQTVPPGRVQAVQLTQGPLWRWFGWWRVKMNVAGYGQSTNNQQNSGVETVLLSVGSRADALTALWLVLPDLGEEDVSGLLDAAVEGTGEGAGFWISPRRARWLDPLTRRRNGLRITRTALLMRSGRFVRSLVVVPHERTQSLGIEQGPLERAFRLANLKAHSVAGPITPVAYHLDDVLARDILMEQAERARTARAAEGPEEWMRRVGVPAAEPADDGQPGGGHSGSAQPGGAPAGGPGTMAP